MKKYLLTNLVVIMVMAVVTFPEPLGADVIFMKDGSRVEGSVLLDLWEKYLFKLTTGEKKVFLRKNIEAIRYGNSWKNPTTLKLKDGKELTGIVVRETCEGLVVSTGTGSPYVTVAKKNLVKDSAPRFKNMYQAERKKEGWYFTGLPLVAYSNENGFRGGGRLYFYQNWNRDEPNFYRNPYGIKAYIQATASTKEMFEGQAGLDWKNINGTMFGFSMLFEVEKKFNGIYFGTGSSTTERPLTDNLGNTYYTWQRYNSDFLSQSGMDKYNSYQYLVVNLAPSMILDWGSPWKFRVGYRFQWMEIIDWASVDSYTTLLDRDRPLGYRGGFISALTASVMFDLRDFAPDPREGILLFAGMEGALPFLGSTYGYFRANLEARMYYTFWELLTFAFRASYRAGSQGIPFYTQFDLGGYESLRGFLGNRFAGTSVTLFNMEMRFHAMEFLLWGQRFGVQLVAFFDAGNAYSSAGEPFSRPRFEDYKLSAGGGIIGTWNQSTVMHLYIGKSDEDLGISINFGHTF